MKTVNLELSKQLKEAGYPQDCEYVWYDNELTQVMRRYEFTKKDDKTLVKDLEESIYASPTADEILDQFPVSVAKKWYFSLFKTYHGYDLVYENRRDKPDNKELTRQTDDSLADAAARMYLYLKKENLL